MAKSLLFVSAAAVVVASFAIAACVGDEPSPAAVGTVTQGALGGPCFANGTCNTGLTCDVGAGSKCVASSGTPPTVGDASPGDPPPTGTDAGGPAVVSSCKFQTTTFPCGDSMPPTVCYGGTASCTLTGCNVGDVRWECNSARQCGTACCIPPAVATFAAGANCTQGTLVIAADAGSGATCGTALACATGETQLCQANSDCPKGQRCTPGQVVVPGGTNALNGTIVGVCAP